MWNIQYVNNINQFDKEIKQRIIDQDIQDLKETMSNNNKGIYYKNIKDTHVCNTLPNYLSNLSFSNAYPILKLRTQNTFLPVEKGRHLEIEYKDRSCPFCPNTNKLGDEQHYILECGKFTEERKIYIKRKYYKKPSTKLFLDLINSKSKSELVNLSKFINIILKEFTAD